MMELPSFTGFFESSRSPKGMLLKWSSSITLAWFTEFYRVFFLVSANVYLVFFYNNNNNRNEMGTESILVLFYLFFFLHFLFISGVFCCGCRQGPPPRRGGSPWWSQCLDSHWSAPLLLLLLLLLLQNGAVFVCFVCLFVCFFFNQLFFSGYGETRKEMFDFWSQKKKKKKKRKRTGIWLVRGPSIPAEKGRDWCGIDGPMTDDPSAAHWTCDVSDNQWGTRWPTIAATMT